MQLFHLTSLPLHILQQRDEVQVFTTDVTPVSFDEKIVLDNFTSFFFRQLLKYTTVLHYLSHMMGNSCNSSEKSLHRDSV